MYNPYRKTGNVNELVAGMENKIGKSHYGFMDVQDRYFEIKKNINTNLWELWLGEAGSGLFINQWETKNVIVSFLLYNPNMITKWVEQKQAKAS